jgi:hypothetical protein
MGRIRAIGGRKRALLGLIALAALAASACIPARPTPPPPPPEAAFSVSTAPMVASFTDQSTGKIKVRSWDFGDGATSDEQNPTHTYAAHGDYVVTLTVTGPGGTDAETQTVSVKPPAPVASFTAEPPSGTVPLTVLLTSTSTGFIDTTVWDLDADGVFDDATGPTATQTFTTAGDHTVGLSVTGPGGTSTTSQAIPAAFAAAAHCRAQGPTDLRGDTPGRLVGRMRVHGRDHHVCVGLRQQRDRRPDGAVQDGTHLQLTRHLCSDGARHRTGWYGNGD